VYPTTPLNVLTPARVSLKLYSTSAGIASNNDDAVLDTSGTADAKIRIAIKQDARGSKPDQP
jgi:hypothetical protein